VSDTYRKSVLTVIAVCLVLLCFRLYSQPQSVLADQQEAPKEVKIVGIAPNVILPIATNSSLPVQIQGSDAVVPVGIIGAKSTGTVPVFLRGVNNGVVLHTTSGQ
jgi:hypothetical protein